MTTQAIVTSNVDDNSLHFSIEGNLEFVWLELTNRCNLRCVHCYARSGPYEPVTYGMVDDDWVNVLTECRSLGCEKVQFIGGEPYLYPGLRDLVRRAIALGYSFIEIFTNGTRTSADDLDFAKETGVHLAFSFYATNPLGHDAVTTVKGSHCKTLSTIKAAISRQIPVRVGVISMAENAGESERTLEFIRTLGVASVRLDHVRGRRRDEQQTDGGDSFDALCGACLEGKLAINSRGEIYPCVFSRFCKIGNIRDGITSALSSEEMQTFRRTLHERHALAKTSAKLNGDRNHQLSDCNPPCEPNYAPCNPPCNPPCEPNYAPCNPPCNPPCEPNCSPFS